MSMLSNMEQCLSNFMQYCLANGQCRWRDWAREIGHVVPWYWQYSVSLSFFKSLISLDELLCFHAIPDALSMFSLIMLLTIGLEILVLSRFISLL